MNRMNIDLVRQSVAEACRYARVNKDRRIQKPMIDFYKEGGKSPSMASLILHDQIKKSTKQLSKEAFKNGESILDIIKGARNIPKNVDSSFFYVAVLPAYNFFTGKFHEIYPKTRYLRDFLITHDRIKMDKVTKKAGLITKLRAAKYLR